jgi:hypothetical protein
LCGGRSGPTAAAAALLPRRFGGLSGRRPRRRVIRYNSRLRRGGMMRQRGVRGGGDDLGMG